MRHRFLAIEGNIGTGKTALSSKIAADFNKQLVLEEFEDNSFLPKFYEHPRQFAFPLEMSFLAARFNQLKNQLFRNDLFESGIVSDYIFFKCLIFSKVNLDDDEYDLYLKLFDIINLQLPKPDLLVYLHKPVPTLQENIRKRGRSYESHITDAYLNMIQQGYFEYLKKPHGIKVLIINTEKVDFVGNPEHYQQMVDLMNREYPDGIHTIEDPFSPQYF